MLEEQQLSQPELLAISQRGETELRTFDGLSLKVNNLPLFRNMFVSPKPQQKPTFIFVSGTSESGKSTLGKIAVETGLGHRLKIYKTLAELVDEGALVRNPDNIASNPFDYATWLQDQPSLLSKACELIADRYIGLIAQTDVPLAVVETIKHPWMATEFARRGDLIIASLYIDADLDQRVAREAAKTGIDPTKMRQAVLEKDLWKDELASGASNMEGVSDAIIRNDGSYASYDTFIRSFLALIRNNQRIAHGRAHDFS